eukprot:6267409-Prymnesium_polylepis.1
MRSPDAPSPPGFDSESPFDRQRRLAAEARYSDEESEEGEEEDDDDEDGDDDGGGGGERARAVRRHRAGGSSSRNRLAQLERKKVRARASRNPQRPARRSVLRMLCARCWSRGVPGALARGRMGAPHRRPHAPSRRVPRRAHAVPRCAHAVHARPARQADAKRMVVEAERELRKRLGRKPVEAERHTDGPFQ